LEAKKIELKESADSAKVREETRQIELEAKKIELEAKKIELEAKKIELEKKKMKLSFFEKRMDTKMTKQLKTYQGELPQCPELVYHNAVHLMFLVAAALVFVFLRRRR
jgi:hypothetical protein